VRSSTRRTIGWAVALVAAVGAVGVAYLRDDGEAGESLAAAPGPTLPRHLGQGCGEAAATDPSDLSIGRALARCAPEAPAAAPLAQPGVVRVALTDRSEGSGPLLVAADEGEFTAENLMVTVTDMTAADAYAALGRGEVDAVVGGLDSPFLESARAGSGAKVVLGGPVSRAPGDTATPQVGLWARADLLPDVDDWSTLEGHSMAIAGGLGSAAFYPIDMILAEEEVATTALDVMPTTADDAARQLSHGDVGLAWLPDPELSEVAGDDAFQLLATLPAGEAVEGTVFGPRLLGADRAAGLAYVRAIVRTINTHMSDGYDREATAALAGELGVSRRSLADGPSSLYDWEIRTGTIERIQESLVELGSVSYEQPLPEQLLVDRSLYQDAVAAS
jgi:NitT/TauT family transport system substrate-binding protein